jgi:dipeptidyl-peptidase 4
MEPAGIDKERGILYFYASPENATQKYLYSVNISGNEDAKRVTPMDQPGTHMYNISKDGKFAFHIYSSHNQRYVYEFLNLDTGKAMGKDITSQLKKEEGQDLSFFTIKLDDGTSLDAWMVKPANFDPNKKYPIVMSVYGEPAAQTVVDRWGTGMNRLYDGNMAADGYIYASIDNRGTPAPKGAAWRKAIYKNIGQLNIQDQANGLKKMMEMFPFIDASRVAVHGWSGGGSSTCNLLFQYPNLYQTGIAVAAVANQLTYDNIYQERYMGLIDEGDKEFFVKGSPVTHAKNLKGNLLYIHGTGDDNVHYQNAEMLINELIKNKKQFSMMAYPNRTHSINEGEGTTEHLRGLFTKYLKENCSAGAR